MRLATKLRLIGLLPLVIACLTGFFYMVGQEELNKVREKALSLDDLYKDLSDLALVSNASLSTSSERQIIQWNVQYDHVVAKSAGLREILRDRDERQIFSEVVDYIQHARSLFDESAALIQNNSAARSDPQRTAYGEHLQQRLAVTLRSALPVVAGLHNANHALSLTLARQQNMVGMGLLTLLALSFPFFTLVMVRNMSRSFALLRQAMARVASGHFSEQIAFAGEEEFVVLSSYFNEMAGQLAASMVSRNALLQEIVQRKQSETELAEARNLLQSVLDTIPVRVFWKDLNGVYLGGNRLFAQDATVLGAEALVGLTDLDMPWRELVEIYRQDDRQVMTTGQAKLNFEEPYKGAEENGVSPDLWARTSKIPLRDGKNQIIGILGIFEDITAQKKDRADLLRTKDELADHLRRLEMEMESHARTTAERDRITEMSQDLICTASFEGYLIYTNGAWERVLGYANAELVTKPFIEWVHPDDRQATIQALSKLVEGEPIPHFVNRYRAASGRDVWLSWSSTPDVERGMVYAIGRDVSESIRSKQALEENQRRLQEITATLGEGLFVIDQDGQISFANPASQTILGWAESELLGKNPHQLFHPHTCAGAPCPVFQSLASGQVERSEIEWFQCRDGSSMPVALVASPIIRDGHIRGTVVAFYDIRERLRAEQALRESEERFRSLVVNLPGTVYRCALDEEWTMSYISDGIALLCGHPAEEFIANRVRSFASIIHPEDRMPVDQAVRYGVAEKRAYTMEYRILHADGSVRWVYEKGQAHYASEGSVSWLEGVILDITDRKHTEMEYRSIIATALDGFWLVDLRGKIIEVNHAYCQMSGYGREELLSMTVSDLDELESGIEIQQRAERIIRQGSELFETSHRRKNGSLFRLEISVQYLNLRGGAFVVFMRDLSRVLRAEERFHLLFNSGNDAIIVHPVGSAFSRKTRFVEVNDIACSRLGYSREELLQLTPVDIDDPLFPPDPAKLASILTVGHALFETVHVAKDGRRIPVEINARHFELDGRKMVLSVVRDITDRKRQERLLAELLEFNRKIIADSATGIIVYEESGSCVLANEAVARIIGATVEQVQQQNFHHIPSWRASGLLDVALTVLATQTAQHHEVHMVTSFGKEVWLECDLTPIRRGELPHLMIIINDISHHRLAERALIEARQAAEAANRAKSEFLANMSHEIRTPMNGILGLTHLALGMELSPKLRDYLVKVHASSRSLLAIINDILDYSKIEAGRMELDAVDFDLEQILENTTHLFSPRAVEKNLELLVEIRSGVPCLLNGDPLRLGQVLNNLVGNAVKFTARGEIRVVIDCSIHREGRIELQASVRDSGIGMTEEEINRLFQPFQQADGSITRRYGGSGLGLVIAKNLVEKMGGTISLESVPGQGSCFRFNAWMREPVRLKPMPHPHDQLLFHSVLVVDDSATAREILRYTLERWNVQVAESPSGEETLARLQANERYDLTLIDLRMPNMDGITLAKRIETEFPGRAGAIILMSAAVGYDELLQESMDVRKDAIVAKPITPSSLFDALMTAQGLFHHSKRSQSFVIDMVGETIRGAHILLVEDNEINQQVAKELLQQMGMRVHTAGNGREAIMAIQRESFDLVLMDLQMPEMDGLEATRIIRRDPVFRHLPIIAMTAAAMSQDRERCLAVGMNEHVAKPIDPEKLVAVLLQWLPHQQEQEAEKLKGDAPPTPVAPAAEDPLPEKLPGFDLRQGATPLGNNRRLWRNLIIRFAEDFAQTGEEIRNCCNRGELEAGQILIHRLRGVAGNLGASALHDVASAVEAQLKNGDVTGLPGERFYHLLAEALTSARSLQKTEENGLAPSAFDLEMARSLLAEVEQHIEKNEFVPGQLSQQMRLAFAGSDHSGEVDELLCHLDHFDFENAHHITDKVMAKLHGAPRPLSNGLAAALPQATKPGGE